MFVYEQSAFYHQIQNMNNKYLLKSLLKIVFYLYVPNWRTKHSAVVVSKKNMPLIKSKIKKYNP